MILETATTIHSLDPMTPFTPIPLEVAREVMYGDLATTICATCERPLSRAEADRYTECRVCRARTAIRVQRRFVWAVFAMNDSESEAHAILGWSDDNAAD